jgi:hypothetical protein
MRIARLLLVFVLLSSANAQTTWTNTDMHEVDMANLASKAKLSAEQTKQLRKLDNNLDDLRIEKIDMGSLTGYAVQGFGGNLCGAVGNCAFWILDAQMHILLKYIAQRFAVLPTNTNGKRDIVLADHSSATDSAWGLYHFTGTYYRRAECADVNYAPNPDVILKKPVVTTIPCAKAW